MARKLRGFERVLDAPSLFAVAYGEIASSLYIALGIVAGAALGLTPLVLLVTGGVFVLVSLSYAEGTSALPETGGAATFVRRAFNDLAGFVTGWVLFLDFLIVMALSALFVPHYVAGAFGAPSLRESPWDAVIGCSVIVVIAGVQGRPPDETPRRSVRRRAARSRRAERARAPRARPPAVAHDAGGRPHTRKRPGLERPRLCPAARDARLHGTRDGCQPRGGGDGAGPDASAVALLRDRAGGRRDGPDRRDRALGLSRDQRRDCSRTGVARAAARRNRRRVRRLAAGCNRRRAQSRRRDLGRADSRGRGDDLLLGDNPPHVFARRARLATA